MADEQAAAPALRQGVIAEVVAHFAVKADGADSTVDLERKVEIRAWGDESAGNGAGGVVEE